MNRRELLATAMAGPLAVLGAAKNDELVVDGTLVVRRGDVYSHRRIRCGRIVVERGGVVVHCHIVTTDDCKYPYFVNEYGMFAFNHLINEPHQRWLAEAVWPGGAT